MNGKVSSEKYTGSIESALFRTCSDFAGKGVQGRVNLERLYRQVLTSVALRNGDAHLKNFGLLFTDAADGSARLSPAYDIVTTTVYIKNDLMALNLNGTKRWSDPKALERLGARAGLKPSMARTIMAEVADGIEAQIPIMHRDITLHGHPDLADRMAAEWASGIKSLGCAPSEPEMDIGAPEPAP